MEAKREKIRKEILQLISKGGNDSWKKALGIMVDEGISIYEVDDELNWYCENSCEINCENARGCDGCKIYEFNDRFKYV